MRLVVLAAIALVLGAPSTASAALPVTFDTLAPNTTLSTQYAADGVTFLNPPGTGELPVTKDVGSKANSGTRVATPTCPGCEFEDRYMLIQLSTIAQSASLRIGIDSTSTGVSAPIRVEALRASQGVIDQDDLTLTNANFKTLSTVTAPAGDGIAFLRIRGTGGAGWTFGIDDVTFTPASTVTPDFAVVPQSSVLVRQGGSAAIPVDILRFNGSSGNINLLPSISLTGVSATFAPNVIGGSGTATTTMTVHAANDAVIGTSDDIAGVTGVPTSPAVGTTQRTAQYRLTVEKSFALSTPDTDPTITACTPTTGTVHVSRARSGFPGTIALTAEAPDGYAVSLDSTSLPATGDGTASHRIEYTLTATRPDPPVTGDLVVHATSPGTNTQNLTIPFRRTGPQIDAFDPTSGFTPRNLMGGSLVTVSGRGFCAGSTVEFGTAKGTATPATIAADGTSLTVQVPRLAATGPLTVATGGRRVDSVEPFTVISPRSRQGFKFVNYTHPGVDLAAVTNLYGAEQTQISWDPCNPLPGLAPPVCPVPLGIPNPLTGVYIGISNAALAGNASCFGISVTSEQLTSRQIAISAFRPAGAIHAWDLNHFSSPDPDLAEHIRAWHSSQLSSSYLGYWIDNAAANVSNGGRGSRTTIENELRAGRHPVISLRFGSKGHAVVAHNLRSLGPQDYDVDVYDPNLPVNQADLATPAVHAANEDNSVIHVRGGNWDFPGAFDPVWRGGSDNMVASPLSVLGRRPVMPTDPFGVVSLLIPLASGTSTVSQVQDSSGKKLLGADGDLNPDAATRPAKGTIVPTLTGNDSKPMYALPGGAASKLTLQGNAVGTGGASVMAPGFGAEISGLKTAKGSSDQLELVGKTGEVEIDSALGGNVGAKLARQLRNGDQLGADVTVSGGDKGGHDLRLDGGSTGLKYENDGSGGATLKATLSWAGTKGTPGETKLPAVSVPAGGSAQAVPSAWGKLGASPIGIVVKNRGGKVVKRVSFRPKVVKRVSNLRLGVKTAKDGKRTATVRVTFRSVPKGATVSVAVNALQDKKIVATQTQTVPVAKAKGTKTYTFALDLPKGSSTVYGTAAVVSGAAASAARAKRTVKVS